MKIKNEKEVLQAFCGHDDFVNPWMKTPFLCERVNKVCATDGHYMLMVDSKLLRRKYETHAFNGLEFIHMQNIDTIVTMADIEAAIHSFHLEPEMVTVEGEDCECSACDGDGEVQWEYTDPDGHVYYMDYECPVCNGTGETPKQNKVPTGRMLPPQDAVVEIDGAKFLVIYLMKALEGLKLLGCQQLRHTVAYENTANLFDVQEGITLLIMPVFCPDNQGVKVKTTKKE